MGSPEIVFATGIVLLILGGRSGTALFLRVLFGADNKEGGKGTSTLWGLFITGVIGGLFLVVTSLK
jgi:hypothetical protein